MSFTFGLGGLRDLVLDLFRFDRRTPESSDVDAKCFEFTGGTGGGASVGDWEERPYLEVFLRTILGGERLPVGVEAGDALWNSAISALESTLLSGGRADGVSFGGDGSRFAKSRGSWGSDGLGERSQIMIVPSLPVLIKIFWSESRGSRRATSVTAAVWPHSRSRKFPVSPS